MGNFDCRGGIRDQQQVNRDQQQVNREQQTIVTEQQERERRRYADRVNWWVEMSERRNPIIHIENRSSAPISPMAVIDGHMQTFDLSEDGNALSVLGAPPCTAVLIEIPRNSEDFGRRSASLLFSDPIGSWIKRDVNAEPHTLEGEIIMGQNVYDDQAGLFINGRFVESLPIKTETLSDCGGNAS